MYLIIKLLILKRSMNFNITQRNVFILQKSLKIDFTELSRGESGTQVKWKVLK